MLIWLKALCQHNTDYALAKKKKKNAKIYATFFGDFSDNNKNKISLYFFLKYENERERWVNFICKINVNLEVTNEMVVKNIDLKCFERVLT